MVRFGVRTVASESDISRFSWKSQKDVIWLNLFSFLSATWEIMQQRAVHFEFNEKLLEFLMDEVCGGIFTVLM